MPARGSAHDHDRYAGNDSGQGQCTANGRRRAAELVGHAVHHVGSERTMDCRVVISARRVGAGPAKPGGRPGVCRDSGGTDQATALRTALAKLAPPDVPADEPDLGSG